VFADSAHHLPLVADGESGSDSIRIEFTANSLLFTVPDARFANSGQNSMISLLFFPCYLAAIKKNPFRGSACIRKIRVYPRELVGFSLLSCYSIDALDRTTRLHHWRCLCVVASEGESVELAGRDRKQYLLYCRFLAIWALCRFLAAMDLHWHLGVWLVELGARWRRAFETEDKSHLKSRNAGVCGGHCLRNCSFL
jgi:hypothetical protein